ncbi:type III-B CRISPR module RAMP protein Cmr1 [candidate division KSB3 bacterium]|uniref:Type III-B CRISPR module RAMP protein Cmr1 n=1 Tax=candidate division KSB3 bacterium TaxID=2044937 RepID=A0A2G6K8K0_9BACT|nr:MAG: type III-B CRISPR module RAMP protein Cmr1 [candidate division KSB3 bacterium]
MELTLKTLTPIWTGGIDGTCDRIHETGIIGSLRWWYEALVRIDPELLRECGMCEVCQNYGTTGWRQRFKLEMIGGSPVFRQKTITIPSGRIHQNRRGKDYVGGWRLGSGIMGEIACRIIPLNDGMNDVSFLLPIVLAEKWGGLGAKTQQGYGIFCLVDKKGHSVKLNAHIEPLLSESSPKRILSGSSPKRNLPNLQDMFFAKLQFEAGQEDWWKKVSLIDIALERTVKDGQKTIPLNDISGELRALAELRTVPVAPAFKNWLRFGGKYERKEGSVLRTIGNKPWLSKELFGFVGRNDEKQGSLIHISSAYLNGNTWEIRVWGWIPETKKYNREEVLRELYDVLCTPSQWRHLLGSQTSNARLAVWREFNSVRDTVRQIRHPAEYLTSLLFEE